MAFWRQASIMIAWVESVSGPGQLGLCTQEPLPHLDQTSIVNNLQMIRREPERTSRSVRRSCHADARADERNIC
jgi:hypothetical protein